MNTNFTEILTLFTAIVSLVMIVKFFSLTSDVSKITNRLVIQKGLEIQFKAESADFRNDPQKMNYFLDYIFYIHVKSNLPQKLKQIKIAEYCQKIRDIGGEDFIPKIIKSEYKF